MMQESLKKEKQIMLVPIRLKITGRELYKN